MANYTIQTSFTAGEISPSLYGHCDLARFHIAASTLRNMFVSYRGGAYSRAGTKFVVRSKQSIVSGTPPRVIPFQFNINQGYCLEFGDQYMRVIYQGAPVLEAAIAISNVTNANPTVVTATNGFANGDWVLIQGVGGTVQLNSNMYIVQDRTATSFSLTDLDGAPINSLSYGVYTSGGSVSRVFTLATPYHAVDLPLLKFTQSADVMSFVHPNYPPYDLSRITATNWTILPTQFGATIAAPGHVTVQATVAAGSGSPPTLPTGYAYTATAVAGDGTESVAAPIGVATNGVDISATLGSNIVNWDAVPGAVTYNVYRAPPSYNTGNGTNALPPPAGAIFGYVATSYGTQFVDSNTTPDETQVPPIHTNPFAPGQIVNILPGSAGTGYTTAALSVTTSTGSGLVAAPVIINGTIPAWIILNAGAGYAPGDHATVTGNGSGATATLTVGPQVGTYPGTVAYFQQRRVYAGTLNNPDTYYMSKPGLFRNFDTAIPVEDTDAITGTPWSQQVNGIQWLIPMPGGLVVLTGLGAWQVTGAGGSALNPVAISPSSQQAQPQAFNGCSAIVPPLKINFDVLYVQAKGSIVRDLAYNYFTNIYTGNDLTEISGQLFTGYTLSQVAWCEEPHKIAWYVRNDGILLSLTYLKEQEVYGWARHDTFGQFFSVCAVTEPPVDALYLVTTRYPTTAPNQAYYYVERMDDRLWDNIEDCWCVDCGLENVQPTPQCALAASAATGTISLVASLPTWNTGSVGQVVRMGGGIIKVVSVQSPMNATGVVLSPIVDTVPNSPDNRVVVQSAGSWTLTAPITVVSGLSHLIGLTVTGLADGIPIPPQVVSPTGTITLAVPATQVIVGLPFSAQLQSVYLDSGQPTIQGRRKTITAVTVRVENSSMIQSGTNQPDGAAQFPIQYNPPWTGMDIIPDQGNTYSTAAGATVRNLYTGDLRVNLNSSWQKQGQVAVQQVNPLPLQITALIPEGLEGDIPEQTYSQRGQGGGEQQRGMPRGPGAWMLQG